MKGSVCVYSCPISIGEIRRLANWLRGVLGFDSHEAIDMPKLYDRLSDEGICGKRFSYVIVSDNSDLFDINEEAMTDCVHGVIYIKESVWNEACSAPNSRAVFTLAHELGHYFLVCVLSFMIASDSKTEKVAPYEDPEWQANTFASEFLMPFEACLGQDAWTIHKDFNVSYFCASVRVVKIREELGRKGLL